MKKPSLPELQIPVIYVNPPFNRDHRLIERVSRAGGIGVADHVACGPADFSVPPETPHGVRVRLKDAAGLDPDAGVKLALLPLEDARSLPGLSPGELAGLPVPVVVEVGSGEDARAAEAAGAAGLIARGHEGPGRVALKSGFVLLQEVLNASDLPVFLRGGVSEETAAGAVAAGAAGTVLDMHLLFTEESALEPFLRKILGSLSLPATVTLADGLGRPYRVYARVATKMIRELRKLEDGLAQEDVPSFFERIEAAFNRRCVESPDTEDVLIPISEDLVRARILGEKHRTAESVIRAMADSMIGTRCDWPFAEGSRLCKEHGTRFPVVQGPMAHVSDNADFLVEVGRGGALPFLAMGNMPPPIARECLQAAREKTGGRFGVGLIGLEINRKGYEAHLEIMKDNPPPFAILAAGGVDLARRIEEIGTTCYLHCPSPSIVTEGLAAGLRHFVFEGAESGGHIGSLGSLDLWTADLRALDEACRNGIDPAEVSILFAGGVASKRASAFVAGMVGELVSRGLKVGLQMGTAYLSTEEAVSSRAVTPTYRDLTLKSSETVIVGRTVNIRARAAGTPMADRIIEREMERVRDGVPLTERKELYELDNLGSLRLASKGCAIDPETATLDCPVFHDLSEEEQLERGLYLMGQAVSLLDTPRTMERLHEEIVVDGRDVFESARIAARDPEDKIAPAAEPALVVEVEHNKEPIAVVGIGLRMPGSDTPSAFWEQIIGRVSGIGDVPKGRWDNPDFHYHPDPKTPDKTYSRIGGFVRDFVFDPLKYRIPPSVAAKMDRTQQMAVACVGDALEDAGLTPADLKDERVGIILGNSMGGETTDWYAARLGLPRTLSCLEQAFDAMGMEPRAGKKLIEEFRNRYLEGLPNITEDSLPGELANVISGRVANVFNLHGPNFTVDAACASSMAAVMNAMAALRGGTIDFAVSGGVDAAMHPSSFVKFCKVGALSPDGSRPFDEGANGFVMGEGAGILILKRLSDAVRDHDRVYAVILEIGSSSDGRGKGITAPNAAGQERAIKACLSEAGIPIDSIGLFEAHGTSTPVGDKTELTILDKLLREAGIEPGSVGIGSVKSQIGHLKAAAGAAGMIKAILSLYNRTLPPTMNVTRPNQCIDWESSPLFLLSEPRPWETTNGRRGLPRRAGVSAFGFGGTNFHVLLQEHVPGLRVIEGRKPREERIEFIPPAWPSPPGMNIDGEAWVIGAADPGELAGRIDGLLGELTDKNAKSLAARFREQSRGTRIRCGFAGLDAEDVRKKLALVKEGIADSKKTAFFPARGIRFSDGAVDPAGRGIAFLFPGQGSQYPFMLRDLAERFPVVAETLAEADEILESVGSQPVTSTIFPASDAADGDGFTADGMKDTQMLQPMILAANIAIFRLLDQFGVKAAVCAGHSLGEYAACVAAGVFSFRDGLEAVAVRGREMSRVSIDDPGLMMGIPADARVVEEVLNEVDGYVVAANKNSPRQTVISGETAAVKRAGELFKARGLEGVLLPVSAAFHSGVVAPAREPFMKTLRRLTVNPPAVPVISNVTGDYYPVGPAASENIRDLLGKQFAAPVEWVRTLRRMHSDGVRTFLEIGPKRVLTNLALDTLPEDVLAAPTNHPKKGGIIQLMESLAALAAEGLEIDWKRPGKALGHHEPTDRATLEVVRTRAFPEATGTEPAVIREPSPLDALLDAKLQKITAEREFPRYLELQAEPIRGLIKSGFKTFVDNILPMEKTVREVKSAGMDFQPVVVSGLSAGLPSDVRFPFERENLDDLILGRNFIKKVPDDRRNLMLEKNIERLVKGPEGEAELRMVEDTSGVIKLAGFFSEEEIASEYGLDERLAGSMDVTTRLAVAAGIEALKDAGIPLIRRTRTTSTGRELPDSWALPEPLRAETGVIFAAAFPGLASLVEEVSRETAGRYDSGAKKRLIEFYTGLVDRLTGDKERDAVTSWFTEEFSRLNPLDSGDLYTFNRNFLLRVMSLGSGQLAQFIKAQGPNTHVDAACASTTQAILLARDWIRSGQAKRVIVVAADDVAGRTLFPWVGSGFLAMGAATTIGNIDEAALPFDDRRAGLILGSAAVGIVLEKKDLTEERGMEPIVSVDAGVIANSAFHGTRLDVDHIASLMDGMISKWEEQTGKSRDDLAEDLIFMSHETYSPKRGGSAAAEIEALRKTFGEKARLIPITNTKGYTGHTMGVGVEDVVAMRCLRKGLIPPLANLKKPDPEFSDLNLSRGGECKANHALRLAAGFGSQIVMAVYKLMSREENRITDLSRHRTWLKSITGYSDPIVSVDERTLRVAERPAAQAASAHESQVVAEAPVAPAAKIEGGDAIREKILSLLAEKTGYPADMLDTSLDLEADLGIDTVKQAEFISEVRDSFGIPRIEGLKIADFPTIEHIIGFVQEQTGRAGAKDHEPAPHRGEISEDRMGDAREKILSLLAEKTGYPADMLDTGLDLEADLGIDTVKQAEFISEVREAFGIPRIEGLKIADFPTIDHIIEFVRERTAQVETEDHEPAPHRGEVSEDRSGDVRDKILSLLADKTGYPAEMLDTDLDLEADLGIDTVKQAEFISEVRDMFGIPRIEGLKIADFPTINHIIEFVFEKSAQVGPDAASEREETDRTDSTPAREEEIRLFEARRTVLLDLGKTAPVETDRCLIFGGPDDLAEEVKELMSAGSYGTVERLRDATSPLDPKDGERIGIVNLFPAEPTDSALRSVFELYVSLARGVEHGPAFLVTVVCEDGAYGLEAPAKEAHIAGAAAGATKAFAREYPETRVRLLDLHPESDRSDMARTILRSLGEEFPLETGVAVDGTLTAVRLVPSLGKVPDAGVRAEDVILVSGGGRGITTECLKRLAQGRSLTLAIMGRTVLSGRAEKLAEFGPREWESEKDKVIERLKREGTGLTPVKVERELSRLKAEAEVFRTLNDLRSLGAEVIYRSVDIRDADRVDAVIKEVGELCGRVDLVLHAAGIDVSRSLASKTIEEIENVYNVKVGGMINILTALDRHGLQPRRVVGFGSVSGRFGNVAQVDYSAANDGLSHLLRRFARESDTTACTIDWAPWSEIGMATRGSVQQSLEAAGIDFVPPKTGAALLEEVLARPMGESCEVLVGGRFGPFAADAFQVPGASTGREETFAGQKGRVERFVPGEYVRASVKLDPSHVILNDHRIDRAAVMPGVGGMEIMRKAASLLDPEAAGASFEDLRFHSPLKVFGTVPFEADVEAVRVERGPQDGFEYSARIISWFADKQGRKVGSPRLHHECRLVPSREETETSYPGFDNWDSSVWIPEDDIYEAFFHGPGFRFLDHVLIAAKGEAIRFRRMETEACSDMFTDSTPAAVETVFQAGAALGTESRGIVVLPTGIRSVQVLDPNADPAFGELVVTGERSWDAAEGRRILGFDGILRDPEGRPVLLLLGIEMAELGPAVLFPHRVFRERVRIEEISDAVEADGDRFLARTLTPGEAREFAEKTVPKRAKEWIAGRLALKRSVKRMLAASGSEKFEENSIEIVQDDQGKPAAVVPGVGKNGIGKLSLSHSDGLAVAAASQGDSVEGIGVDIEVVESRSDAWVEDYFTEEEIRAAGTGDERWTELTKIWCLKEAALKAVGTGLRFDLREIDASRVNPMGRATLEFRDNIARFLNDSGHGSFEARVEVSDGTVNAIVISRRPAGNADTAAGR